MKTLGLIGGTSWHSTIAYYRLINELVGAKIGSQANPPLIIHSINIELMREQNKEKINTKYLDVSKKLENAGAEAIVICANTPHMVYEFVQPKIGIPILHIADATAEVIKKNKLKTVGLLGTAFTMERTFYKDRLIEKHGINVLIPNDEDRKIVHDVIYNELCLGKIEASSKQEYIRIINELSASGAQAVILGCTEIGMLVKQADTDVLLLDTTAIHAQKAVEQAMQD